MAPISIDGEEITGATIDGEEVQEITVDGQVAYTAGPDIPDSVVDNFESADADPRGVYGSGATIADYYRFDTASFSRTASNVVEGVTALGRDTTSDKPAIASNPGDGLNRYPDEGDSVAWLVRGESNAPSLITNVQDNSTPGAYGFNYQDDAGEIRIYKYTDLSGGSDTELTSAAVTATATDWYWGEATLPTDSDDSISFTFYETDTATNPPTRGAEIESITANDNDYATDRGVGATARSGGGSAAVMIDWIRVI